MSKLTEYRVFLYYKQGDDFRYYLDESDNLSQALESWAADMKTNSEACMRMSKAMAGRNILAHAEGHHVSFEPADEDGKGLLDMLVRENVINEYELEEEADDDDDDGR